MTPTPPTSVPEALVEDAPRRSWAMLVPILALLAAGWFLARAWDQRGVPITIHFEAGHGLKAGDSLRYRGIEVGRVDEVRLGRDLGGVDVRLTLEESARHVARAGSRFWIVRPRIGTGGLDGLDTLVGARYLDVAPGPEGGTTSDHFRGLEAPPVIVPAGALELMLEAAERGSVSRGGPVTWRRLQVGQVLSVGLSSDARQVLVRIAIDPEYAPLVLTTTRFFETSGLDLDLGLDGLHLEMESLQTLFSGGIAFATPEESAAPALTGQRFTLASAPKDEWLAWRPALAVGDASLPDAGQSPEPVRARLQFESGLFNRNRNRLGWALWTSAGLIGPTDVVHAPAEAKDGASLEVSGAAFVPVPAAGSAPTSLLLGLTPPASAPRPWPANRVRLPQAPEDCLAIGDTSLAPLALDAANLGEGPAPWNLDPSLPIDADWHGAPVISRRDGALIGLIVVSAEGARIAAPPEGLPR